MTGELRYLWCGEQLCQKRSAGDTVMSHFYSEGEQHNGWLGAYYAKDHLGSVRDIVDAKTGSRLKSLNYSPRGQIYNSDGFFEAEFEFAGMQSFPFTSNGPLLTYHRLYHPGFGRWLSRDPIEEDGGINLYGYVGGDFVNLVDPLGLDFYCELCHGNNSIPSKFLDWYNPPPMEMAKGGKENIDNEYVRDVQAQGKDCNDPCKYLRKLYRDEKNSVERDKIKKAMKRFNCDGKDRFQ